jgi:hypothetical protein
VRAFDSACPGHGPMRNDRWGLEEMLKSLFAALSLLLVAAPARADIMSNYLNQDRVLLPSGYYSADYTVPSDGKTYSWDFFIQSDDPDATIRLRAPNEVFGAGEIVTATGPFEPVFLMPAYTFYEVKSPGRVSYIVSAQQGFDHCDDPGPVGSLCRASYYVWGNGTTLEVFSKAPVTVHLSVSAVPEPSAWALMIAGFGACGVMLRRQRRLRLTQTA